MALQWLSLVGTIWLQSINGTNSNFPAYSSQLKRLLSLSQLQLNNLAFASDAGKLLGWIAGFAAVYLPLWLVLLIGSVLGLTGYGLQYLFLTGQISYLSYGHVFFLTILAGNSICWINTVCYTVTILNFPFDRQVAVGLSTSYVGLSAKIYTSMVDVLVPLSPSEGAKTYLLLNSMLPLVICVIAAPIVREIKSEKSRSMESGFVIMFFITVCTGAFAVITTFNTATLSGLMSPLIVIIGMGIFLWVPLVVPLGDWGMERVRKRCSIRRDRRVHDTIGVEAAGEEVDGLGRVEGGKLKRSGEGNLVIYEVCVKEEIGVKLMVRRVEFWLYFFVYLFGVTLGLVYLNNLGQIAESREYSSTSTLVSLSSAFGFFGRLLPSILDYFFSRTKFMVSRPAFIAAMMAPISASFFLLLNATTISLYISTAVIGLCTGAITSISVSTTTELFGTKNFSVNHNIVVANIPIGSFIFGDLAALLYLKQSNQSDGRCMGMECYQTTFIIWGSLSFLGTFLALLLHIKTKNFYSQRL